MRALPPGIAFTVTEHAAIAKWMASREPGWPRIELALNYPHTPEMLGVAEDGWIGPTYFMWRTANSIIIERFSGGNTVEYETISEALDAISEWSRALLSGIRQDLR